ncbi:Hypothetical predicted protein [Scomber scombrus]|uniref:Uncharacterized protein n=1 Tax=Scomber scombrus TaxID=13677 RepID=A0AAV1P7D7_SCOSC
MFYLKKDKPLCKGHAFAPVTCYRDRLVRTKTRTAMAYINRQGKVLSSALLRVAEDLSQSICCLCRCSTSQDCRTGEKRGQPCVGERSPTRRVEASPRGEYEVLCPQLGAHEYLTPANTIAWHKPDDDSHTFVLCYFCFLVRSTYKELAV